MREQRPLALHCSLSPAENLPSRLVKELSCAAWPTAVWLLTGLITQCNVSVHPQHIRGLLQVKSLQMSRCTARKYTALTKK